MADFPPQVVAIPLQNQADKFLVLVMNPATNKLAVYKIDATAGQAVPIITVSSTNEATYP